MRKTLRASVLMLALCVPAFAGDIANPASPQPPQQSMTAEEQAAGNIQDGAANSLSETVLSLLEGVLTLF
jgi:hypothetical protein